MRSSVSLGGITGLVFTIPLALALGFAQTGGGSKPPSGGGGTTPPPVATKPTTPTSPTTTPSNSSTSPDTFRRPLFFTGRVVLDEGTPPPEPVPIDFVCGATPRRQAYTDSKGRFSFELGRDAAIFADASTSSASGMGGSQGWGASGSGGGGGAAGQFSRNVMGCELRASLPGFHPASVTLTSRRSSGDDPDVGTLILKRIANVEGLTISATSEMAPKDAKRAYEKALNARKKDKLEEAENELRKAVEIYPKYAVAWYALGQISARKNPGEARNAFNQAIAVDPKYINPYRDLALLAGREKKWGEVADLSAKVISLNPVDFPDAYFYNAAANYNLDKVDQAEKSVREAARLDKTHQIPKINHLLGVILLDRNDLKGAAENLRLYLENAPEAPDAAAVRKQLEQIDRKLDTSTAASAPAKEQPKQPEER